VKREGSLLLPWSYSRLTDYERCAFRAYEVHVLKNKEEFKGPAMERGQAIHKLAEDYVLNRVAGGRRKLARELTLYKDDFANVIKRSVGLPRTELKFGITRDWKPTEFFGRDVWGRGVWDLVVLDDRGVRVIDHKTGRIYPETSDQLRFYAAAALAATPAAPTARAEAWHLDQPPQVGLHVFTLTRADGLRMQKSFDQRVMRMEKDKRMLATVNAKCRWCHLAKSKGGPCPKDT